MKFGKGAHIDEVETRIIAQVEVVRYERATPLGGKIAPSRFALVGAGNNFKADIAICLGVLVGDGSGTENSNFHEAPRTGFMCDIKLFDSTPSKD